MKKPIGFSTQILVLFISLCVLCIGLVGVISYRITNQLNIDLVMTNLRTLTDSTYNLIDSTINTSIRNHLRAIAEQDRKLMEMYFKRVESGELSETAAKAEVEEIFLGQTIGETGYTYVVDTDGTLMVHPLMKGSDLSNYTFIKEQIDKKNGYMEYSWKNPSDPLPRDKVLYMSYFDKWQAIISVSSYKSEFTSLVNVDDFKNNILSIVLGETGYLYVMNSRGELVIHPKLEGTSIYDSVDSQGNYFIQEIIKNKNGTIIYPWKNPGESAPREKIVIYKYFKPMDWYVCSGVYIDELIKPIEQMKKQLTLTALCILIFAVCISLWYSRLLLRPITGLIRATERVIDGHFDVQIVTRRGDEIGRLTTIFNKMLTQIRQYMTDLNKTNKELETVNTSLEQKVEERTRQLEALSNQDWLTGIANRRKLDEYLLHEYNLAARSDFPLSLIILDIDFFKKYNDRYGHLAGDDCLKEVARTLSESLHRTSDFAARYGGEEFIAILSNSSHNSACEIAERIRTNIEQLNIPHEGSTVAPVVTVSLGICTLTNCQKTPLRQFITLADQSLYRAKEKGRNRIEGIQI
ncbi:sensor domain-containing diguanylate cyclase [Desulfopila aestuarii]|uniref:diguanylate cyclase n=1 Tax=Desulfopila aestuarii DSM 18488 TaxID=1121416 RepID=A0A1M7Y556_9BACT|nr:diguanylate cyclase [Desulfopila aestuarii]SHO47365.1 diguanylate cyclase (GGDEF) domain-containing protein [Desulfopila aestuarii DSM 18488]